MEFIKAKHTFSKIEPSRNYEGNVLTHTFKAQDGRNFYINTSTLMPTDARANKYYPGSKLQGILTSTRIEAEVKTTFGGEKISNERQVIKLAKLLRGIEVELGIEGKRVVSINTSTDKPTVNELKGSYTRPNISEVKEGRFI